MLSLQQLMFIKKSVWGTLDTHSGSTLAWLNHKKSFFDLTFSVQGRRKMLNIAGARSKARRQRHLGGIWPSLPPAESTLNIKYGTQQRKKKVNQSPFDIFQAHTLDRFLVPSLLKGLKPLRLGAALGLQNPRDFRLPEINSRHLCPGFHS